MSAHISSRNIDMIVAFSKCPAAMGIQPYMGNNVLYTWGWKRKLQEICTVISQENGSSWGDDIVHSFIKICDFHSIKALYELNNFWISCEVTSNFRYLCYWVLRGEVLQGTGHIGLRKEQLAAPGALPAPLVLRNPEGAKKYFIWMKVLLRYFIW